MLFALWLPQFGNRGDYRYNFSSIIIKGMFMPKTWLVTAAGRSLHPLFTRQNLPPSPQKLVVIKPCCLGDVVLATPALAALATRFPHTRIDVAVGSWSRAALAHNPHVQTLIDTGAVGQGAYSWRDILQLARKLRAGNYDLAVTLDRSPLVGLVPWLAKIPHRLGLDSRYRGFAHTMRVTVPEKPRHEAQIYLDCTTAGWETTQMFWTAFYPSPAAAEKIAPLATLPFVILHPAGGVNPGMQMTGKRWPPDRFATLADRLASEGWRVLFSGTADDLPLCREISARMQTSAEIVAGKLSLDEFGALCRRARLFVGGDTGAMHVAVAAGCPTVAIFGPTDPRRYGPFAPAEQVRTVWRAWQVPSGGVGQGHATNFSWENGASVDEVWQACTELLAGQTGAKKELV